MKKGALTSQPTALDLQESHVVTADVQNKTDHRSPIPRVSPQKPVPLVRA